MDAITQALTQIFGNDLQAAGFIVLNLFFIESLLSIDNAAVLATMVMDLPEKDRGRALKYGIIGAYAFRGICLLFASYIIQIVWLKAVGGLYLLYLTYDYFKTKATPEPEDDTLNKKENRVYKATMGRLGPFWSTVIMVEVMDLAFSIDNVLAAVAYTQNIYLIWIGVFIGILAMRFVSQVFVKLLGKFPFLETIAFIVIAILGVKLLLSFAIDKFIQPTPIIKFINGHEADFYISIATVSIFVIPVLTSLLFNFPRRNAETEEGTELKAQ
jgi:YkoY family integral membrane protein